MTNKPKKKPAHSKYKEDYCIEIVKYFDVPYTVTKIKTKVVHGEIVEIEEEEPNYLPTLYGFARKIGVCRDTVHQWTKTHSDFSDAVKHCKAIQADILLQNGLKNKYNRALSVFALKNLAGWKDTSEIDVNTKLKPSIIHRLNGAKEILTHNEPNVIQGEVVKKELNESNS